MTNQQISQYVDDWIASDRARHTPAVTEPQRRRDTSNPDAGICPGPGCGKRLIWPPHPVPEGAFRRSSGGYCSTCKTNLNVKESTSE